MTSRTRTRIINSRPTHLFWCLLSAVILFAGFYIYFVNSLISGAVSREMLVEQRGLLEGELTRLETEYLAKTSTITLELALARGFREMREKEMLFVQASQERVAWAQTKK